MFTQESTVAVLCKLLAYRHLLSQWLSAFPAEAEIVYPPLCYLQPTGREQKIKLGQTSLTVVEVEPHVQ